MSLTLAAEHTSGAGTFTARAAIPDRHIRTILGNERAMNATHRRIATPSWLRVVRGLLLALALLSGMPALAPSVLAEEPVVRDHRDPDARVRLIIRNITIHNDQDWGKGDISIRTRISTGRPGCNPGGCTRMLVDSTFPEFEASDGDVVQFDRFIPAFGDTVFNNETSPEIGFPVDLDNGYDILITGTEIDTVDDDFLGTLSVKLLDPSNQIRFGVFTERSIGLCKRSGGNPCASNIPGSFSVEYEIRSAPLPDLRPVDIKVLNVAGSTDRQVCTTVQNAGVGDVSAFQITIQADGVTPTGGRYAAGRVASGQAAEMCAQMELPAASGPHELVAMLDEPRAIPESVETNNRYVESIAIARTEDSQPTPTPAPPADQADLVVSTIKVNGKTPDGSEDCKDGKSGISAIVRNSGVRDADTFLVRLVVDGNQGEAVERSVGGLKDGKEQEVRFGDVRLKKGDHALVVTVDQKNGVTESNEGNNMLDITASCSDGR